MSACISLIISLRFSFSSPKRIFRRPCSSRNSFNSFSSLKPSKRANWRRRISKMSSAWISVSPNAAIKSVFGSSDSRMTLITSSMCRKTFRRPSRMCSRFSTWFKRNFRRRVTVTTRKSSHSCKIVFRFFCAGRLSKPIITKFMDTLPSSEVCAISVLMKVSVSMRLDFGSNTSRTGCSPSDSSRTRSIKSSISFLVLSWSWLSCFLPAFGFGLVCSSISARILAELAFGGSSVTITRHCPRASFSIS